MYWLLTQLKATAGENRCVVRPVDNLKFLPIRCRTGDSSSDWIAPSCVPGPAAFAPGSKDAIVSSNKLNVIPAGGKV
jgi:hypothetical protein